MVVKLRLSSSGIKEAQRQIKEYKREFHRRVEMFVEKLSEAGYDVAKMTFASAPYAGTNDVKVTVNSSRTKAQIVAKGKSVAFIEFGTGKSYPEHQGGQFKHGTYGKGQGNNDKGWIYKGEQGQLGIPIEGRKGVYRTFGNPPAEAMWDATLQMMIDVERIWKEVMS